MYNVAKKHFIGEYFIDPNICDKLIELHSKIDLNDENPKAWFVKNKGVTGKGYDTKIKKSIDVSINPSVFYNPKVIGPSLKEEVRMLNEYWLALNNCFNQYGAELAAVSEAVRDPYETAPERIHNGGDDLMSNLHIAEPPLIQHYEPGEGFFLWHHERGSPTRTRELVFMTYLNDVPDGGTEFLYQQLTIKARKGKTVIWPANYTHPHRGQISHKHEKYIMTGWLGYVD